MAEPNSMLFKAAPYPPDILAKGWRFELDHERIRRSDTWALAALELRPWLLMLWMTAWEQSPCGSLPASDELISARIGMPLKTFLKHRETLMRGWWIADDGRMYHDPIVEFVTDMMNRRRSEADRKARGRAKQASEVQKAPASVPRDIHGTPKGLHPESDTGTGTGTGTGTRTSTLIPNTKTHTSKPLTSESACAAFPEISAPEPEKPRPEPPKKPSFAAEITMAMRRHGISDGNPGHPNLLALIEAGATLAEFENAAITSVAKKKGFAYAIGMLLKQRAEALERVKTLQKGPLLTDETPYQKSMRQRFEVATGRQNSAQNGSETIDVETKNVTAPALD